MLEIKSTERAWGDEEWNLELEHRHSKEFKATFGLELAAYIYHFTGFDLVKFELDLRSRSSCAAELSIKEFIRYEYSQEAVELIEALTKAPPDPNETETEIDVDYNPLEYDTAKGFVKCSYSFQPRGIELTGTGLWKSGLIVHRAHYIAKDGGGYPQNPNGLWVVSTRHGSVVHPGLGIKKLETAKRLASMLAPAMNWENMGMKPTKKQYTAWKRAMEIILSEAKGVRHALR